MYQTPRFRSLVHDFVPNQQISGFWHTEQQMDDRRKARRTNFGLYAEKQTQHNISLHLYQFFVHLRNPHRYRIVGDNHIHNTIIMNYPITHSLDCHPWYFFMFLLESIR